MVLRVNNLAPKYRMRYRNESTMLHSSKEQEILSRYFITVIKISNHIFS